MRYIEKNEPIFFEVDVKELREKIKTVEKKSEIWDKEYKEKRALKEYILENEQNYLCGYCEAKVTLDESHIEHIKPKHLDYDSLTFDYDNLLVSCNGNCFSSDKRSVTCGHKKGKKFDEALFLNPTKIKNMRDYFIYTDNGYIGASNLDEEKAKYTLNLLQLNTFNNYLPEARLKALEQFRESVKNYAQKTGKNLKEIAIFMLLKENLAFISFLQFKYKYILEN